MICTVSPFRGLDQGDRIRFSKHDIIVDVIYAPRSTDQARTRRYTREEFEATAKKLKKRLDRREGLIEIIAKLKGLNEFATPEKIITEDVLGYAFTQSGLTTAESQVATLTLQGLTHQEISEHPDVDLTVNSVRQYCFIAQEKIRLFLEGTIGLLPNDGHCSIINLVYFLLHTCVGKGSSPELTKLGKLLDSSEFTDGEQVLAYLRLMGFTRDQIKEIMLASSGMVRIVVGEPLPLKFRLLLPEEDIFFPGRDDLRMNNLELLIVRAAHHYNLP